MGKFGGMERKIANLAGNNKPRERMRMPSRPADSATDAILLHHHVIGNRAVATMLESLCIQAKLTIGQPNDVYEQEADRVADMVMRMPDPYRRASRGVRTVSSPGVSVVERPNGEMISGEWKIAGRSGPNPLTTGGRTDEELLEGAFREICPLASRSGDRIRIPATGVSAGHSDGCRCLQDIEAGLPALKTSRPPAEITAEPHGWSSTSSSADPVQVSARHPDDPFQWGYWTTTTLPQPTERRHVKPFWQTVAHEVCGHVANYVRTRGAHAGGRSDNPRHHDPAIEQENLVAGEHGVAQHEQRGYEFAHGGRPATRHAGESFLSSSVPDFQHASAALPAYASTTSVIDSVYQTSLLFPVFVELVGVAYANEGGISLALDRAHAAKAALITKGVPDAFTSRRGAAAHRYTVRGRVEPGLSVPNTCQTGKNVEVYMYHDPRSLGP